MCSWDADTAKTERTCYQLKPSCLFSAVIRWCSFFSQHIYLLICILSTGWCLYQNRYFNFPFIHCMPCFGKPSFFFLKECWGELVSTLGVWHVGNKKVASMVSDVHSPVCQWCCYTSSAGNGRVQQRCVESSLRGLQTLIWMIEQHEKERTVREGGVFGGVKHIQGIKRTVLWW